MIMPLSGEWRGAYFYVFRLFLNPSKICTTIGQEITSKIKAQRQINTSCPTLISRNVSNGLVERMLIKALQIVVAMLLSHARAGSAARTISAINKSAVSAKLAFVELGKLSRCNRSMRTLSVKCELAVLSTVLCEC